jgi:hypothetical protein
VPAFQLAEHDLYLVAAAIAPFFVTDGLAARFLTRDFGAIPVVSQRFQESIGVVAPIADQPF